MWRRAVRVAAVIVVAGLVVLALLAYWPVKVTPLVYTPLAPMSYQQTISFVDEQVRLAPSTLQSECRVQLLHHGRRTERVFVLLHGLSNCPAQFRALGELLFAHGYNVLIPRLPFHGEQDRMTEAWKGITAQMMLDTANEAVDLARNLGKQVTVVAISVNATIAAWLAQNRADVEEVVLLAPFLAPKGLPGWAVAPATRLVQRLPNQFFWWDPKKKASRMRGYAYPRFPTHVVAQTMRVSLDILEESRTAGPRCGSILVVTTASDGTASLSLTRTLVSHWRRLRPDSVRTYEFPAKEQINHDFIDPTSSTARVDFVYPKLISLLVERRARPRD